MTASPGLYIALDDGFWWSGTTRGTSWTGGPDLGVPPDGMSFAKATLDNTGADAKAAALGRTRTRIDGDVVLSPSSPILQDADVYGVITAATSGSAYDCYLDNVYVHGKQLPTLTPPYTQNYESSIGLVQNASATNATIHMDGVTLVPDSDFVDTRWDGCLGHDMQSDGWGLVIAHTTDGIGLQNSSAGTNPPINVEFNRLYVNWLCYWGFSPGSPNDPQVTHNDCMQGFGGDHIWFGRGTFLGGWRSMPDGFLRADGTTNDDPFGYVGEGDGAVPPSGTDVEGTSNSCIQFNKTEGTWSDFRMTDVYCSGGGFGINNGSGSVFTNSSCARVRFDKLQYNWPPRYPTYDTVSAGLVWDTDTVLYDDGTTPTIR